MPALKMLHTYHTSVYEAHNIKHNFGRHLVLPDQRATFLTKRDHSPVIPIVKVGHHPCEIADNTTKPITLHEYLDQVRAHSVAEEAAPRYK